MTFPNHSFVLPQLDADAIACAITDLLDEAVTRSVCRLCFRQPVHHPDCPIPNLQAWLAAYERDEVTA